MKFNVSIICAVLAVFGSQVQALRVPKERDFSKMIEGKLSKTSELDQSRFEQDQRVQSGPAGQRSAKRIDRAVKHKELERRRQKRMQRAQEIARNVY